MIVKPIKRLQEDECEEQRRKMHNNIEVFNHKGDQVGMVPNM